MATIDVDQVLESGRLRGPVLVVLLCAASTLILDGFDIQAAGFVAPALVNDLHVTEQRSVQRSPLRSSAWPWERPASALSAIVGAVGALCC
jgi:hypothetical protein